MSSSGPASKRKMSHKSTSRESAKRVKEEDQKRDPCLYFLSKKPNEWIAFSNFWHGSGSIGIKKEEKMVTYWRKHVPDGTTPHMNPLAYGERLFSSVEHMYQWLKIAEGLGLVTYADDTILRAESAKAAKSATSQTNLINYLITTPERSEESKASIKRWLVAEFARFQEEDLSREWMTTALKLKYSWTHNPGLAHYLVSTGSAPLGEAVNRGQASYWNKKGQNTLGILLMQIRNNLLATLP